MEYKELNKQFWGKHMRAGGYFAASSGNVTDEAIAEYIRNQELEEEKKKGNFEINRLLAAFSRKYEPANFQSSVVQYESRITNKDRNIFNYPKSYN